MAACAARSRVVVAGEEEQQRVTAELDEGPPVSVGNVEELLKAGIDAFGHLLGTHLPVPGQALGHVGEAGDVAEDHRPFDGLPAGDSILGIVRSGPFDGWGREVGEEVLGPGRGLASDQPDAGRLTVADAVNAAGAPGPTAGPGWSWWLSGR